MKNYMRNINITEKEQRDIESYVNRRENYGLMREKDGE